MTLVSKKGKTTPLSLPLHSILICLHLAAQLRTRVLKINDAFLRVIASALITCCFLLPTELTIKIALKESANCPKCAALKPPVCLINNDESP